MVLPGRDEHGAVGQQHVPDGTGDGSARAGTDAAQKSPRDQVVLPDVTGWVRGDEQGAVSKGVPTARVGGGRVYTLGWDDAPTWAAIRAMDSRASASAMTADCRQAVSHIQGTGAMASGRYQAQVTQNSRGYQSK